jgi:transcriptional regulator with XRE-family HTH domain
LSKIVGHVGYSLGAKIIDAREAQGLSQRDLAKLMGVWPAVLCHWEKDVRSPNLDTLIRIAAALNVQPASLLP